MRVARAHLRNALEQAGLVLHISSAGIDELDELIVSLLEDHIDVVPRLVDVVPDVNEVVIDTDEVKTHPPRLQP